MIRTATLKSSAGEIEFVDRSFETDEHRFRLAHHRRKETRRSGTVAICRTVSNFWFLTGQTKNQFGIVIAEDIDAIEGGIRMAAIHVTAGDGVAVFAFVGDHGRKCCSSRPLCGKTSENRSNPS